MSQRPAASTKGAPGRRPPPKPATESGDGFDESAELRAVLEAMPEAVVVCGPDDRIRIANQTAERLFAGRPPRDREELLSRLDTAPAGAGSDGTRLHRLRDVPNRWFQIRTVPVRRPSPVAPDAPEGHVIILRDVTALSRARAERRAFLAILSHELRTPITTIYAGSRVLARRSVPVPASTEIAADINAEAEHLYDVVEDLLVLTRAEQGLLDMSDEPVLLQRVVETTMRLTASRAPGVPIERTGVVDPPAVRGDPLYIEQAVRNLVTAASRYAGPDAPVVIGLAADDREVSLHVLDSGPDLRPAEADRLLDLVEEPRGERQNAGIGPFVCRRIVESMSGRIWAKPRDDAAGGAEFGFALPRYDEPGDRTLSA
jgi:signal transduction histidine kinase